MVPVIMGQENIEDALAAAAGSFHQLIAQEPDPGTAIEYVHFPAVRSHADAGGVPAVHIPEVVGQGFKEFRNAGTVPQPGLNSEIKDKGYFLGIFIVRCRRRK